MNLQLCALLCNFLVLSTFTVVTGENVNMKKNVAKEKDIYIDDEDFADGSGNGDVIESSGSGFGPPDDDGAETRIEIPGSKKTQPNSPPKIEKEATLPMPSPKPQSPPPPPPPQQSEIAVIDTFTTPAVFIQPEVKKLPEPEKEHPTDTFNTPVDKNPIEETNRNENVYITNSHDRDRTTSFFAQPGILAAVIGGAVVGLLCAILVVMFIVYRMRKKDEGSYALEEMKRCPATNPYMKPNHREFFA